MCWDRSIEQDTVAATPQLKPAIQDSNVPSKPGPEPELISEVVEIRPRSLVASAPSFMGGQVVPKPRIQILRIRGIIERQGEIC